MQNSLTELQRSRLEFHCDLDSTRGLLALSFNIRATTFSTVKLLQLVGDISAAQPENLVLYEGVAFCTTSSALGTTEIAYSKLSPNVIDDSLLVKSAGKVVLRGDELKARERLYKKQVEHLKQLIGMQDSVGSRAQLDL